MDASANGLKLAILPILTAAYVVQIRMDRQWYEIIARRLLRRRSGADVSEL
jgi:hypothetical protein